MSRILDDIQEGWQDFRKNQRVLAELVREKKEWQIPETFYFEEKWFLFNLHFLEFIPYNAKRPSSTKTLLRIIKEDVS